jgi:transposase
MFSLTASDRFYLYPYPTDMRKSFYTLSGIVTNREIQKECRAQIAT